MGNDLQTSAAVWCCLQAAAILRSERADRGRSGYGGEEELNTTVLVLVFFRDNYGLIPKICMFFSM